MGMLVILFFCAAALNTRLTSAMPEPSDRPHCLAAKTDFEGILVTCQIPKSRSRPRCEICVLHNGTSTNDTLGLTAYNLTQEGGYILGSCHLTFYPRAPGLYSFLVEIFPFRDKLRTNQVSDFNFPSMSLVEIATPLSHCKDSDVTLNCTWTWLWEPDRIDVTVETDSDVYMSSTARQYSQGGYFVYEIISKLDFGLESRNTVINCLAHYDVTGYVRRPRSTVSTISIHRPAVGVAFKLDRGDVATQEHAVFIGTYRNITCAHTGDVEGIQFQVNLTCVGLHRNMLVHMISSSPVSFTVYGNETYHMAACDCSVHLDRDYCVARRLAFRVVTEAYPHVHRNESLFIHLNPIFQHSNGSRIPEVYSVYRKTNSSILCHVNISRPIRLLINVTCWDTNGNVNVKLVYSEAPVLFHLHGDQTYHRTVCLCTATTVALTTAAFVQANTAYFIHHVDLTTSNDIASARPVIRLGQDNISIVSGYYVLAGVIAIVLLPIVIASVVYLCLSCRKANIFYSPPTSGSNSGQTRSSSEYDYIRDSPSAQSSPLPPQGTEPLLDSSSSFDSREASDSSGSSLQEHRYFNSTSDEQDAGSTPTAYSTPTP